MTYEKIFEQLHQNKFAPVYFLMGEESFFIDQITDYILENALPEKERDFNQSILYGKDTNVESIISIARRFPMMSEKQVLVVREAQTIRNIENLVSYVKNPLNSTILVINYKHKSIDKRKIFAKELAKSGILFESKKIYENQIPRWITAYLAKLNCKIENKATFLLAEFLGNDLYKISNAIEKLRINMNSNAMIKAEDIEQNIGISKDFNNFELNNALGKKEFLKANKIIKYFASNEKQYPISRTISMLFSYFSKVLTYHFLTDKTNQATVASKLGVNFYFVKDYQLASKYYSPRKLVQIIALLREYDLKSKGTGNVKTTSGDLLKELIFKILH